MSDLRGETIDRIQELEIAIAGSERSAIRYYVENREFFDRIEDGGGGARF